VIAADTALDGKGGALRKTRIIIEGSKIVAIDPKAKPIDYDLRGLTVLPGWIDAHVHITSSFGKDGKSVGGDGTTHEDAFRHASNAWATVMAGFTTVQSMGSPGELALRNAIANGSLSGPRILTAVGALSGRGEQTGTAEEIRAFVRKQKEAGADLIKIYAAGGFNASEMTLSQEQLNAACDEAKKLGLRTLVHAFREAVCAATLAGCTQIEHGVGATDEDLKIVGRKGDVSGSASRLALGKLSPEREEVCWHSIFSKDYRRVCSDEGLTTGEPGVPPARSENSRTENRFRHRRPVGYARAQRRRVHSPRARLRSGPNGGDDLREFAGGGGARHDRSDRLDRAWS